MRTKKKLLVCPFCHSFYSVKNTSSDYICEDCRGKLLDVDFDHGVYMSFTDEQ